MRPEVVKKQVRSGAAGAVAGHAGFTAVRIEDAHAKICVGPAGFPDLSGLRQNSDAIGSCAIVTITYPTGKVAEIVYILKLFRFEDDVVIAEAVEFGESWGHLGCGDCVGA